MDPLNQACKCASYDGVEAALADGADPSVGHDLPPLFDVCWGKDKAAERLRIVRLLLAKGADPHARGWGDLTPALMAAENGLTGVVQCLVEEAGADVDAVDDYDKCALLHFAAYSGDEGTVTYVLHVAPHLVHAENKYKQTPIFFATSPLAVSLLLDAGADMNHKQKDGHTALQNRVRCHVLPAAVTLVAHGAIIDEAVTAQATKAGTLDILCAVARVRDKAAAWARGRAFDGVPKLHKDMSPDELRAAVTALQTAAPVPRLQAMELFAKAWSAGRANVVDTAVSKRRPV